MITAKQIKAARALSEWSQQDLADQCDMSKTAIANIESGQSRPSDKNMTNILNAFDRAGVEFITDGVREKKDLVQVLEGAEGLRKFFDDVYLTVMNNDFTNIYISGVDEKYFWSEENIDILKMHAPRMNNNSKRFKCYCLIRESDDNDTAVDYAEYRRIPDEMFSNVPFYIYGKKLAIILWKQQVKIILIDDIDLTNAYKKQFNLIFEGAK